MVFWPILFVKKSSLLGFLDLFGLFFRLLTHRRPAITHHADAVAKPPGSRPRREAQEPVGRTSWRPGESGVEGRRSSFFFFF